MACRYSSSIFLELLMTHTLRTSALLLALLASTATFSQTATTPVLTPAQLKAQQDLAVAQAAADKANKEAAEAQAKAAAATKAAQDAQAVKAQQAQVAALCDACGIVKEVRSEKRKGQGGALGIIGGAVAGGVLGNQVGKGTGNKVATVGGAVGGAVIGNEIQKRLSRKTIHITQIQMKDGSLRSYESEAAPTWGVGNTVKLDTVANTVTKL
jgi:outer membrane lipoprotein SlyB